MRRLIARVARACGWKTSYSITYVWSVGSSYAHCTQTIDVRPWLRDGDISELNEMMRAKARECGYDATPNIINITRLGA